MTSSFPRVVVVSLVASLAGASGVGCSRGDAPKPTSVAAETTPTSSSTGVTTSGGPAAEGPALFAYEEETSTVSFWRSGLVRLVVGLGSASKTCDSTLGDKGNMWTSGDVQAAFDHADVQKALAIDGLYRSAYPTRARLVAGDHSLTWVNAWKELPPEEPAAVHHLHEVLHVLLENRASLCP